MRHLRHAAIGSAFCGMFALPLWIQAHTMTVEFESPNSPAPRANTRTGEPMRGSTGKAKAERAPVGAADADAQTRTYWEMTHRASKIIGTHVRNTNGEALGDIKELVINPQTGELSYAVVSFGGVLGLGDKLFAVPWKALRLDSRDHAFILDIEKERLRNAPGFDPDRWPDMANAQWNATVQGFYGQHDHASRSQSGRAGSKPMRERDAAARSTTGGESGAAR